jgi:Ca2+-binding RTX toxin-like protein
MIHAQGLRNIHFADVEYATEGGGRQNEHRTLIDNIGPSNQGWMQVLRPGELTIHAGADESTVVSLSNPESRWMIETRMVTGDGWVRNLRRIIYVNSEGIGSSESNTSDLNQYKMPIYRIRFVGTNGDDAFDIDDKVGVASTIYGLGGNDTLSGGSGVDNIYGGSGSDRISGGPNVDHLLGQSGNDRITGDGGDDWIYGGSGRDDLYGGDGGDHLFGAAGFDRLFGEAGNDVLDGGAATDILFGGLGYDELKGGLGQDYLDGGRDGIRDRLEGNEDDDVFINHRVPVFEYDFYSGRFVTRWQNEDWLFDFDGNNDSKFDRDRLG